MHCSDCGKPIKPVVAVDIDGTVAEYHAHLLRFIFRYYDISPIHENELFDGNGFCEWDGSGEFENFIGISREEYREAKLAFRQGGMKRTMPCFKEANLMVECFHDLGCEVWFTTTRPWQRLDNVDPDTREWLRRWNFQYEGLLYDEDKYGKLVEIVGAKRIVGVIDDLPEMYDRAQELELPVYQPHRNHNSHVSQARPVGGTLAGAIGWVGRNVEEWRQKNEQGRDQSGVLNLDEGSVPRRV